MRFREADEAAFADINDPVEACDEMGKVGAFRRERETAEAFITTKSTMVLLLVLGEKTASAKPKRNLF
jgi:hypothetical protein